MCAAFSVCLGCLGVFEISIPGVQTGVTEEQSLGHSVFEGFLAVVLATPCSAPFVGTAVGFALTQGLLEIFLIFAVLGLGLAAPFAALALVPGLAEKLPRPGNWMLRQRAPQLCCGHAGLDDVGAGWGARHRRRDSNPHFVVGPGTDRLGLWALAAKCHGGQKVLAPRLVPHSWLCGSVKGRCPKWCLQGSSGAAAAAPRPREDAIAWVKFEPAGVQAELGKGRPVFVDFTADWCITCKVNERTIIETPEVIKVMKELNVATMKGDYTKPDDVITATLQEYGKGGVPMYLVYSPKNPKRAEVLPEVFTKALLTDALRKAAN